jgi:hypothetical protein
MHFWGEVPSCIQCLDVITPLAQCVKYEMTGASSAYCKYSLTWRRSCVRRAQAQAQVTVWPDWVVCKPSIKVCSLKFWWNRIIDVRAQYVQPVLQLMTFCWSTFEWKWFAEWTSLKWKPILYQEAWQVTKGKNWKVPFISLNMLPPPELIIVNEGSRYRLIIWDTFRISSQGHGVFHNNQGR